jgi:hypothetical protein
VHVKNYNQRCRPRQIDQPAVRNKPKVRRGGQRKAGGAVLGVNLNHTVNRADKKPMALKR